MLQQDISWDMFVSVMAEIQPGRKVSLQGEGEPTLHPQFWSMVEYVSSKDCIPYTITNGSRLDVQKFDRLFPTFGVSIDTTDPIEAKRIGRHGLLKVLDNLKQLLDIVKPSRVLIHTVDYGQPLELLKKTVADWGCRHVIQGLQQKDDYGLMASYKTVKVPGPKFAKCSYVDSPAVSFHSMSGKTLPCVYMKDHSTFVSREKLKSDLAVGQHGSCSGCTKLTSKNL